jgi:hypothetical protein
MKNLSVILLLSISVFSLSCKKDDTCTLSSTSIVGTYKTTAATIQANASATPVDDYATWEACEKDDLISINADGSFLTSEGAVACSPANNFSGNWSLSGSNFTITVFGFSETASITDFNCSSFKIRSVDDVTGEITITTLTKQ